MGLAVLPSLNRKASDRCTQNITTAQYSGVLFGTTLSLLAAGFTGHVHATEGGGSNNKGREFAIGPSIKYANSNGWFLTAKWQQESSVRNRAEGDAYWLKLTVPL